LLLLLSKEKGFQDLFRGVTSEIKEFIKFYFQLDCNSYYLKG
jgi:hypothetical protein